MTVAGFIAETTLPAKQVAESTEDPSSTWVRLVGNRRSRTLRQSARAWQKFRDWLMVTRGSPWPSSVSQVVDYLEERMLEPCGPTVPGSQRVTINGRRLRRTFQAPSLFVDLSRVPRDSPGSTWMLLVWLHG